jgi:hypothetical protein
MSGFEFAEELLRRARAPFSGIFQPLANALTSVGLRCNVEQALVCLSILNNGRGFAIHRQYHGPLTLLDLFEEFARTASKGCQRLDVSRDI